MSEQFWKDYEEIVSNDLNWQKFDKANILITGATGMLGKYLCLFFDALARNKRIKINVTPLGRDQVLTPAIIKNCNYFFHCASPAQSSEYDKPVDVFECNFIGTWNVLKYLSISGHNLKAFVFFSSGEALNPTNCYGEAKRATEALCVAFKSQYNLPTYIVRLDHTFAHTMNLEKDNRIFAEITRCLINNELIKIRQPESARTFVYITDAMDGIFRVIEKGEQGHAYNISNPANRKTMHDLAHGVSDKVLYDYSCQPTIREPLNIYDLLQLGYEPKVDVAEGFRRVIACLKN